MKTDQPTDAPSGLRDAACSPSDVDPYEREAYKEAIHTLQRELQRERKRYSLLDGDYANLCYAVDAVTRQRNELERIARDYIEDLDDSGDEAKAKDYRRWLNEIIEQNTEVSHE